MANPRYRSSGVITSDTLVLTGEGILHSITIAPNDATPTAGTIIVYDSITEANGKIFEWSVPAAVFTPFTVVLDVMVADGIYVGFTTTADVSVTVSYS